MIISDQQEDNRHRRGADWKHWSRAVSSKTALDSRLHPGFRRQSQRGRRALARLPLPAGFPAHILHIRRYDTDIVPSPDLTLEFGDRIGVLMPPERKEDIRQQFRRHGEGDRGVQLRLARAGHGARRSDRAYPDPHPRPGHCHARHRGRPADRRAHRSASCAAPAPCSG